MDGRAVIQGLVGVIQLEVSKETADANPGNRTGIVFLDGRGRTDEIQRYACVNTKVTRKIVSESGAEVIDRAITAVAAFEPRAQRPTGSKTFDVVTGWPTGGRIRRLRQQRSARRKN